MTSSSDDRLATAAIQLNAVGADRDRVPADIALDCLHAAELLELAGARFRPVELDDAAPQHRINNALTALYGVDPEVAGRREVAEATRIARDALQQLA